MPTRVLSMNTHQGETSNVRRLLRLGFWILLGLSGFSYVSCSRPNPCGGIERYCDGNTLFVCVGDQNGWLEFPCKAGEVCLNARCQSGIQPLNDAGPADTMTPERGPQVGALCFDGKPSCADVQHRWLCKQERWAREACPSGKVCSNGACIRETVCQGGSKRCKDTSTVEICFQGQWETQTCGTGKRCETGVCKDIPVCQDKLVRCAEPYVKETCEKGKWSRQRCPVSFYCHKGQCVPQNAPCQDGAKRCKDGGNLDVCSQGVWKTQPCPQGKKCDINQCVPLPGCTSNSRRCASITEEEVCVNGQWKSQPCSTGQQCQVDQCVTLTSGACPTACGQGQVCQNSRCIAWNVTYKAIPFMGKKTDRDPPKHADLNLKMRGWQLVAGQSTSLQTYNGASDPDPPKLFDMFAKKAFPGIINNYQVGAWDWTKNTKNGWISTTFWKVHLSGLKTVPGEILKLPSRKADIYQGTAQALVLFLDDDSITFVYAREDTVANSYAVHVQGVNIAVDLRSLYNQHANRASGQLPALSNGQAFGTALGNEVKVSIRDRGKFMDPRSKKDWW